ncbi:MAG: 2,3-bisphosphoglycerate-independent phosphoglycerate mutase [Deltaproteobacteria bacterium]|nr:2,3-bisphosphoglycerate-independent phosphoglycerate mutase [Deltaproteobacteria bacterium]
MQVHPLPVDPRAPHPPRPVVLAVMDGVGVGAKDAGDAVATAKTPHLDALWRDAPTRTLLAHGPAVGLPGDDDMGNSEVGHNALGAGRIVRQGAGLVQDALADGSLFRGETWAWLLERPRAGTTLHLCGLLSDGNVHAHIDHVFALIDGAVRAGVRSIRLHALADGRDVDDGSYERYLGRLEAHLRSHDAAGVDARIASGGGRMVVTMDRYEADWSIVARGWQAHVHGDAPRFPDWAAAVAALRSQPGGASDQTLGPFAIHDAGGPIGAVADGDSFVFWNFRGDRALELTRAFEAGDDFAAFDRGRRPDARFAGMMQYDGDAHLPTRYLVAPPTIRCTMGEYLVATGLRQFAVSETQKFGHVTYFWNGNRSERLDPELETWREIESDRISFDQAPAMQAAAITDAAIAALNAAPAPALLRLNWANGDMVGHTGNLPATVRAMETVDAEVGRLLDACRDAGAVLLLTADHGNADDMWLRDKKGAPQRGADGAPLPRTSHTLAPVPLTIVDPRGGWRLRDDLPEAGLGNVAATVLQLLGRVPPEGMEPSLIRWET